MTKRSEYALRALIDLGIAKATGRSLLQIGELAAHENLPVKFLEAILVELKDLGYLDSKRGKAGGYSLKKPMAAIYIGAVVRDLEGPLAPISCVSQNFYQKCSCPDEERCGLRLLMLDVRNAISNVLDHRTLAETVEFAMEKYRRNRLPLPFVKTVKANR